MKIAVLTMTFNNNYGGMLQAFALIEILKKLGHQPELIFVQFENREPKEYIKSLLKKHIFSHFFKKWHHIRFTSKIEKNINYFIDSYIHPKTEPIYSEKDFQRIVKDEYDAYIIGSDQVWRPKMYRFINHAFFDFVKNPSAILLSYAPSFGVDAWEYSDEQTKKYKEQIKRFKAVSVREDSGVDLCKKFFNVNATHLIDPTMLIEVDEYRKITKAENEPVFDGELLVYILDQTNEKQYLQEFTQKNLGLKAYSINAKLSSIDSNIEEKIYPTVTSWIKSFDEAKYVITDSFHGCVFSIIFNKPFLVYGNKQRGMARFDSLLKMFELTDRLVNSREEITDKKINREIDWSRVNAIIEQQRLQSKKFLKTNLGTEN